MDVISHADMARLHPTWDHPEGQERLRVLLEAFEFRESPAASEDDVLRCHAPELVALIRSVDRPALVGLDTVVSETSTSSGSKPTTAGSTRSVNARR